MLNPSLPVTAELLQTKSLDDIAAMIATLQRQVHSLQLENQDLKQAQAAAACQITRLQGLADALPIYTAYLDTEQRYQFVNRTYEQRFGTSREQICGKFMGEIFWDGVHQMVRSNIELALAGHPQSFEIVQPDEYGTLRYLSVMLMPDRSDQGEVNGCYSFITDSTARKQLELELEAAKVNLKNIQNILDHASAAVTSFWLHPDQTVTYTFISNGCELVYGYKPQEMAANPALWASLVHPEDWQTVIVPTRQAIFAGTTQRVLGQEYRIYHRNGSLRWVSANVTVHWDEPRQAWAMTVVETDITDRKTMELELHEREYLLRTLANNLPQGWIYQVVSETPGQFHFTYISEGVERLLGIKPEEVLRDGNVLYDLVLPEDRSLLLQLSQASIQNMTPLEMQVRKQLPQGSIQWSQMRLSPRRSTEDHIIWDGIEIDITNLKRTEQELQQAKEAAEIANRAKSRFLANMSHEFRTPLHAILGFSKLLIQNTILSPIQQEYINIINNSGDHLLNLVNDILDISKIEAGQIRLQPISFNLHQLLDEIEELFRLRAQGKHLQFKVERNHLPQFVTTDEQRLRQILINLLGNAIKFTTVGQIVLYVSSVSEGDRAHLSFTVSDTGVGISANELEKIFEPFFQSKEQIGYVEGTGLGLSISRQFARLLGGDLQVESEYGAGAIFRLILPITIESPLSSPQSAIQLRPVALAPHQPIYRILIVEDNWENRQFLFELLQLVGFELRTAENGEEAIAIWQDWQPDLIWMDLQMPLMGGEEATRQIKQRAAWQQNQETTQRQVTPKIIALTANVFESRRAQAMAAGCDDFVCKPIPETIIFEKLQEHLGVQYIYPEAYSSHYSRLAVQSTVEDILLNGLLDAPQSWVKQLHETALQLDFCQALQLVSEIAGHQPELARVLEQTLNNFDFERILALTHPVLQTFSLES